MIAILRKELKTYYCSLFAYVYYFVFFLVAGILLTKNCLNTSSTEFGYSVLQYCVFVVILMIPFCTMRIFSQERKEKTDQLLFTAPVSTIDILMGKYIATAIYVLIPVLFSLIFPMILVQFGSLNGDFLFCAYLGSILLIFALLSIGMFISTLTTNPILSAVITYVIYFAFFLGRIFESIVTSETAYQILHEISLYNKYYDMISGIVRSGDVLYFVFTCVFFFLLTFLSLLSQRKGKKNIVISGVILTTLYLVGSFAAIQNTKVYDYTPEKILMLSEETIDHVSAIKKETHLYYMGNKSQANATYVELLNAYQSLNNCIFVSYIPLEDDEFKQAFLSNIPEVREASIVVATNDRFIYLNSDDYITTVQTGNYSYSHMLEIEDQLTSAILYCNSDELATIARISGHGEGVIGNSFRNLINLANFEFETMNLLEEETDIASTSLSEAAALLIYSPDEDYSEDEILLLRQYMENGGKIIAIIDPLNEDLGNLFSFLQEYGLKIQSGVIIEQDPACYILDTNYYLAPNINESEYTKNIVNRNLRVLSYTSKGIARYGSANGYDCTDILLTSNSSFSKVDNFEKMTSKGDNDKMGSFSVASVSTKKGEGTLFLVTSDIMFSDEADTESGGANSRFFSEMIKSLLNNGKNVWIEGKDVNTQIANFGHTTVNVLKIIFVFAIPAIILMIGVFVIVNRNTNYVYLFLEKKKSKKSEERNSSVKKEDEVIKNE
ncbi:MAG: Gldg family protein [Lachnospiraceae bacterium]